ncbi:response regulator [Jannaschia ovalis]|uniref:Response regulator n=1 Tax=Jannaschia ovalis TaxID=3038773 RepID=A0ABY8LB25_9RHOB|nr:response regulator [Jannaschia sp. GRR-S6-38]WGH78537.1 response regulator [Jannaschia sp. GRR-S6-38]
MRQEDPLKVLIVEDETLIAIDLEYEITDMGHVVSGTAPDFATAKRSVIRDRPDVALMDIRLKNGEDGIDVAQWLREEADVPCIFVSGNLDDKLSERIAPLEPVACVGKPVLGPLLSDALTQAKTLRDRALDRFGGFPMPGGT